MSEWIPLLDYAVKTETSLSTLRRHIKANKIPYKVENGRYLLLMNEAKNEPKTNDLGEVQALRRDLQRAREEIAELKTLIAFYEEKTPQQRLDN